MTKQVQDIGTGSHTDVSRSVAGAPARLKQPDPLALSFRSSEDAISFARDGIEDANRRTAFNAVELVKLYNEGKLHIVLKISSGWGAQDYDLVFDAIIDGGWDGKSAAADQPFYVCAAAGNADWDQKSVLIGVTELVQGPEGVIPSLMRLERAKERLDFRREVFAAPFGVRIKVGDGVPEGEVGLRGGGLAAKDGCGVATLVEGGAEGFNRLHGGIGPTMRDIAGKLEGVDSESLSIHLSDRASWFCFEKRLDAFFQPTDMFLCAA